MQNLKIHQHLLNLQNFLNQIVKKIECCFIINLKNPETESTNGVMTAGDTPNSDVAVSSTTEKLVEEPVEPKDYTSYPALIGPPRAGDKIAYKVKYLH